MGRTVEAGESFEKARANPGQNPEGLTELAVFFQQRGSFEAAAEFYVSALAFDPSNAKLHVGAGQNFAALKRLEEAEKHSAEAIRISPEFAEAHLLHGLVLGRRGQIVGATEQFRQALRLKPDLLDARLNLGIALVGQNRAEALALFEEVLRQNPANATALKYVQQLRAK
jgi:tetratricopeptide (TPR) repeat protein